MEWILIMGLTACLHHHWFSKPIPYQNLIVKESCQEKVSPRLVGAIVSIESGFNKKAIRYESNVDDYSVGLMQVRVATARMMGFTGTRNTLMLPWVNLKYGIGYLKTRLKTYPYGMDGIVAYNQGKPIWSHESNHYVFPDGTPQKYAELVHKKYKKF